MTKKLVQDTRVQQTVAKTLFGSKWEEGRGEETKRKVPFYKKIPGTRFSVDGFNYGSIPGVKYSFLSHYHYDHYQGLTRHWSGQIVCSSLTKRMVVKFLRVQDTLVLTLDPGESRIFDGVEVTSVDANHCPGSLMFVFRLTTGSTILHTGDFRASPDMESDPVFWNHRNIDTVYLDTTYCKPEYDFPPQHLVIEHSILQIEDVMSKYNTVAVLVGAYTIGKERIFKGINLGLDPECSLAKIKAKTRGRISLLEVPYSEHSSYSELKRFIQFLRIKSTRQIIPTVNLRDRGRMNGFFEDWIKEASMRPSSLKGSS
ncbi:DNA cross-link repair protein SNM1 [Eurytemora carolleeae]|uniref:DNA cross-link repair protein SNM1 n=1 Tax=Eurytemora carolleeae TaxID=1294199 RepID=UPI000C7843AC|nr:DNA cross-link repair protein SNM1 [Eurytemora carolleeae]|eukprot:XP_023328869.1 DNA cross-link repair protein SNM1-like [Eurytemora affinis]